MSPLGGEKGHSWRHSFYEELNMTEETGLGILPIILSENASGMPSNQALRGGID